MFRATDVPPPLHHQHHHFMPMHMTASATGGIKETDEHIAAPDFGMGAHMNAPAVGMVRAMDAAPPHILPQLPPLPAMHLPHAREMFRMFEQNKQEMPEHARAYQPAQPQYPAPQQSYQSPQSSCGSNLLIGCQPHVQAVPCSPPAYSAPPAPAYSAPPAYKPSVPAYQPAAPAAYQQPSPPANVYAQAGPPYPEQHLQSPHITVPIETIAKMDNEQKSAPVDEKKQSDSQPASTNHLNGKVTETVTETATPEKHTTCASVENLRKKIDDHVASMGKFREMAENKLKSIMTRQSASDQEDLAKFLDSFNELHAIQTKDLMGSQKVRRNYNKYH